MDALMGPGRDEATKGANKEKFKDRSVCKGYLIGFCPFDKGILGGKRSLEVCGKIHSELMREQFESHKEKEAYRKECEMVSLRDCEFVVHACDAHFNTERARIRDDIRRRKPPLPADVNTRLAHMRRESSSLIEKAESLDDDGFKEKEALLLKAQELKQDIEEITKVETQKAIDSYPREEVCEVCATAYVGEEERKLHLTYKVHENYAKVRERVAELKKKKEEYDKVQEEERKKKRKEEWDKEQEKEKGTAKGKNRDRDRSVEKDKDRGRGRDRDRERDRERNGRNKDSGRAAGRDRSESKGGSRGRGRGHGGSRSRSRRRERNRSRSRGRRR